MAKRRSPEPISAIEERLLRASVALGETLDGISMPELAAAAGIAVGTLYRIAPSKTALAKVLDARAQSHFDRQVFAPFPARLSLEERFHLMWSRLAAFALSEADIAAYLARKPMAIDSAFMKASAIFARDGAATGELKAFRGEELAAIVWGPLSALLRNHACSVESLKQLEQAAWDGLRRI